MIRGHLCTIGLVAAALALVPPSRPALADVRETRSMREALAGATRDTLVVFDIDNTLVAPPQSLGGDAWYYHLVRRFEARGMSRNESIARADAEWNRVQDRLAVRLVDPETPALVSALQAAGVRTLVLTARSHDVAPATARQLASVGLDFSRGEVANGRVEAGDAGGSEARLAGGILFAGEGNDKGRVLAAFLRTRGLHPARVVFVDDKSRHARSVDAAMAAAGLPCTAWRFGAADGDVQRFDPAAADVQAFYLDRVLDDRAARALLHADPDLATRSAALPR